MNKRRELGSFLNQHGLRGIGVEVGVREGNFSRRILSTWSGERLILVDPWKAGIPENKDSTGQINQRQMERWHERTRRNVREFGERVSIWRTFSADGAARVYGDQLDFAYLDANHGYDSLGRWGIVQDLRLWYPKVRPGGLFAGHDYYLARRGPDGGPVFVNREADADLDVYGVKKAVDEFAAEVGAVVLTTPGDRCPSWYWLKP